MIRFTPWLAGVPMLSLMCTMAFAQPGQAIAPLPLGLPSLPQSITDEVVAPGVHHYRIRRGTIDKSGTWMLISGVLTAPAEVEQAGKCFDALGLKSSGTSFQLADNAQQRYDILSGGRYPTRVAAQAVEARTKSLHCPLFARHSAEDKANVYGPWVVDVITLEPGSASVLSAVAGQQGPGLRRQASSLAQAASAVVAVNGGFFVMGSEDGFPGQPSGISIIDGKVNSGPVTGRPAVLVQPAASPAVSIVRNVDLSTYLLWSDGSRTVIDGLNRKPGLVRDCGRDPQDRPVHDHTCIYPDDIVYFPAGSGFATGQFDSSVTRFAIGPDGMLRRLDAGARPTASDAMLAVTGASVRLAEIERQAAGRLATIFKAESSVAGALSTGTHIINGGPTLLMAGQEVRDEVAEGWGIRVIDDLKHDLLMHDWVNRREPRTAIGVKDDGTVLLVTVDGHRHNMSVGMTIEELRMVLKSLGARDAINLDGGGSTALVLGGRLVSQPSDIGGERAVGDAVVILPRQGGEK